MKFDSADDALRAAVMRRFAETDGGAPVRCPLCPDHKVVFPDRRSIEGAIRTLFELDGEARYPYPCPRSDRWHFTRRDSDAAGDARAGVQRDDQ